MDKEWFILSVKLKIFIFFKISCHLAVFKNEETIFQFETSKDISDKQPPVYMKSKWEEKKQCVQVRISVYYD